MSSRRNVGSNRSRFYYSGNKKSRPKKPLRRTLEGNDTSPVSVFRSPPSSTVVNDDENNERLDRSDNNDGFHERSDSALVSRHFDGDDVDPLARPRRHDPTRTNSLVDNDEIDFDDCEHDVTATTDIVLGFSDPDRSTVGGYRYSLWKGLGCYLRRNRNDNRSNSNSISNSNSNNSDQKNSCSDTSLLVPTSPTTPTTKNSNMISAAVHWFERTSEMVETGKPTYSFPNSSCATCNTEQTEWELCHEEVDERDQLSASPLSNKDDKDDEDDDNSILVNDDDDDDRTVFFHPELDHRYCDNDDHVSDHDHDNAVERVTRSPPPVLTAALARAVRDALPASVRHAAWRRIHSIARDGDGFATMLRNVQNHGNTLLVVETTRGQIFGGFAGTAWSRHCYKEEEYFGSGEAFLFSKTGEQEVAVHEWTGKNAYCQLCDASRGRLAMGGGGAFGLLLQDGFSKGSTGSCVTFGNPPLGDAVFDVLNFEVYGFAVRGFS